MSKRSSVSLIWQQIESQSTISIPFSTLPSNHSTDFVMPRYSVRFDRIVTPRFVKDVDEKRIWVMNIRQVLSDNSIRDMLEDEVFAVGDTQGGPVFCGLESTHCYPAQSSV